MPRLRHFFLLALLLAALAPPAWADFGAADKAYHAGDYKAALAELQPLAKAGDAKAQRLLGKLYADGLGLDQDYKQAGRWYMAAAGSGKAGSILNPPIVWIRSEPRKNRPGRSRPLLP